MSTEHLQAVLRFLHDPRIQKHLAIDTHQAWDQRPISICIDGQKYSLLFYNEKSADKCQALCIVKHVQVKEDSKPSATEMIHAIYFPKPVEEITWKWYDEEKQQYVNYEEDELQLLEFEASYFANIQDNFPISNSLFRSRAGTSIFSHCFLPHLSKLRRSKYCMRYTLSANEVGYGIRVEQVRLKSKYPRAVKRDFDRRLHMSRISTPDSLSPHFSKTVDSMAPAFIHMLTDANKRGTPLLSSSKQIDSLPQKMCWVAIVDEHALSQDIDRCELYLTSQGFDANKSTTLSERQLDYGMHAVYIKQPDLLSNSYLSDWFHWTRFRRKKNRRHCAQVNGFWDVNFHSDGKYKRLRYACQLRACFDLISVMYRMGMLLAGVISTAF